MYVKLFLDLSAKSSNVSFLVLLVLRGFKFRRKKVLFSFLRMLFYCKGLYKHSNSKTKKMNGLGIYQILKSSCV